MPEKSHMIERSQAKAINEWLGYKKAIFVLGPRQVGKTTLVHQIAHSLGRPVLWLSGDDEDHKRKLGNTSLARLHSVIGDYDVVVVDEAQRISNAGLMLKLITDQMPHVKLFVTGSSSLDMASETKESLVGRKIEFMLYPFSFKEMKEHHGILSEMAMLEHRMIYGYYPEVIGHDHKRAIEVLTDLTEGLMFKDLFSFEQIRKSNVLVKLVQAIALQVGSEVNYNELSQLVGADIKTIEKYIDLLEQSFVIFRLQALSRNARNELKKGRKIYFYDNGIRNSFIRNFNSLDVRQDTGALWENFLVSERLKHNKYTQHHCNTFFWRTTSQQEIDYIEESGGILAAFEFKWGSGKRKKFPQSFSEAYPNSTATIIDRENYMDFLGVPWHSLA